MSRIARCGAAVPGCRRASARRGWLRLCWIVGDKKRWSAPPCYVILTIIFAIAPAFPIDRSLSRIAREVRQEIVRLPHYTVFDHIGFCVDGTTVTLTGKVTWPALKDDVERTVRNIKGVQRIVNRIDVLPLSPEDDRLRLAVSREIYGHPAFSAYGVEPIPPIRIVVENGSVTLEGAVATEADRNIAGFQASSAHGVLSVINNLQPQNR